MRWIFRFRGSGVPGRWAALASALACASACAQQRGDDGGGAAQTWPASGGSDDSGAAAGGDEDPGGESGAGDSGGGSESTSGIADSATASDGSSAEDGSDATGASDDGSSDGADDGDTATSGGGNGGGPECNGALFPEFSRECALDSNCAIVLHTIDCCGTEHAIGIDPNYIPGFCLAEESCDANYPLCVCDAGSFTAETGQTTDDPTELGVACVAGQCQTFVGPDASGPTVACGVIQ